MYFVDTISLNPNVTPMDCSGNYACLLQDNNAFAATEYKVLLSQSGKCFVKCMKMTYNGQIQLYYLTRGLKSFSALLPSLDSEKFITVVTNLLSALLAVKSNGFLSCCKIDLSFQRIYVDPATFQVSLIYLPLEQRLYEDTPTAENDLRTRLIQVISQTGAISSAKTMQLRAALANGTLALDALHKRLKEDKLQPEPAGFGGGVARTLPKPAGVLRLSALNAPIPLQIRITKDNFVIGKAATLCDAVIGYNELVSRVHCRINRKDNNYFVTDMQSGNGTYVNKTRLQPHRPYPIQNGDVIRMANSDFQVRIG